MIAVRPGSNPDVFIEAALRKHGLDPKKDLKLVNNIGPAAREGARLAGQTASRRATALRSAEARDTSRRMRRS